MAKPRKRREARADGPQPPEAETQQEAAGSLVPSGSPTQEAISDGKGTQEAQSGEVEETRDPEVGAEPATADQESTEVEALLSLIRIPYFRRALVSSLKERLEIGGVGPTRGKEVTRWSESTERSLGKQGQINKEVVPMGLIQESDVGRILQDPVLMDEVVKALVEDSDTMDTLADDIADKLSDALEDDSEIRRHLVDAAMGNDQFKKKLVSKLVEGLS